METENVSLHIRKQQVMILISESKRLIFYSLASLTSL